MRTFARLSVGLAAMLIALLPAAPAQAQNATSFVSSTGGGTACTRAAPCDTIQLAHDATDDQGAISCLDSGPFGGVTITKSITIDCTGNGGGFFTVNGAGIVVRIRNHSFNGVFATGFGVDFANGAALLVENCVFENFNRGSQFVGIRFQPSAPGVQLVVTDTVLSNNGNGSTGGAIVVNPQAGGSAVVSLDRVTVANNVFGVVADGSRSTAGINMTIANSTVHRNGQDGIVATTIAGQAPIGLAVKNTRSLSNNIGIRATGPGVTVRADGATVIGNGTGLVVNNGAALLSAGNNTVEANGSNGAFSGPYTLK